MSVAKKSNSEKLLVGAVASSGAAVGVLVFLGMHPLPEFIGEKATFVFAMVSLGSGLAMFRAMRARHDCWRATCLAIFGIASLLHLWVAFVAAFSVNDPILGKAAIVSGLTSFFGMLANLVAGRWFQSTLRRPQCVCVSESGSRVEESVG